MTIRNVNNFASGTYGLGEAISKATAVTKILERDFGGIRRLQNIFESDLSRLAKLQTGFYRDLDALSSFKGSFQNQLSVDSISKRFGPDVSDFGFGEHHNSFQSAFEKLKIDTLKFSGINDTLKQMFSASDAARSFAAGFGTVSILSETLSSSIGMRSLSQIYQKEFSTLQRLQNLALIDRELLSSIASTLEPLDDTLATATNDGEASVADGALDNLISHVTEKLKTKSAVEIRQIIIFFFTFILPLLLWWRSEYLASQSSQEMQTLQNALLAVDRKIENLQSALLELNENLASRDLYDVKRAVWITEEKRFHSKKIFLLVPGQIVEILERDKKWVYVSAYNPETNSLEEGWVLKKYVTRVERQRLRIKGVGVN